MADKNDKFKPAPDELVGITPQDCADACNANYCAITHSNICGHPHKGGLQPIYQTNPDILERYRQAKIALERQRIDKM